MNSFSRKRKALSILLLIAMSLSILPANISQASEENNYSIWQYLNLDNIVLDNRLKVGEDFKITYKIEGNDIPVEEINENSYKKEIVLVIDTSGSMNYDIEGKYVNSDKKKRLSIVKKAVKNFIDKLTENDNKFLDYDNISIALVTYSDYAIAKKYPHGFSENYDNDYFATLKEIKDHDEFNNSFINSLHAYGGTNIGDGLRKAYYLLKEYGNDDAEKYIVLMTDGEPTSFSFDSIKEGNYGDDNIGYIKKKNQDIYYDYWGVSDFWDCYDYNFNGTINSVDYFLKDEFDHKKYGVFSSKTNYQTDYNGFGLEYSSIIAEMIANDDMNINTYIIGFSNGINKDKLNSINEVVCGSYWEAKTESALNNVYEEIAEEISSSIVIDDVTFIQSLPEGIVVVSSDNTDIAENVIKKDIGNIMYKYNPESEKYEIEPLNFEIKYKGTNPGDFIILNSYISFTDINGEKVSLKFNPIYLSLYEYKAPINVTKTIEKDNYLIGEEFLINYSIDPGVVTNEIVENEEKNIKKEIVLLFDTSGSMNYDIEGDETGYYNKKRLTIAKNAAKAFIDKLVYDEDGDFIGNKDIDILLVSYDDYGYYLNKMNLADLEDVKTLKDKIENLKVHQGFYRGGTNIGDGLRESYYALKKYGSEEAKKYIVLLTDGEPTSYSYRWYYDNYYFGDGNYKRDYDVRGGSSRNLEDVDYAKKVADKLISNGDLSIETFMVGFTKDANMYDLKDIASECNGYCKTAEDENALNIVYEELAVQIQNDLIVQDISFEEFFPSGIEGIDSSDILKISDRKVSGNIGSIVYKYDEETKEYIAKPISFWIKLKGSEVGKYQLSKDDEGNNLSIIRYTDLGLNEETRYFPSLDINIVDDIPDVKIIKHGIYVNNNVDDNLKNYLYRPVENIVSITNGYNIKMGVIVKCDSIGNKKFEMTILSTNNNSKSVKTNINNIISYGIDEGNYLHNLNNIKNMRENENRCTFDINSDSNYEYYLITYDYSVNAEIIDYSTLKLVNSVILYDKKDSIGIEIVELPTID